MDLRFTGGEWASAKSSMITMFIIGDGAFKRLGPIEIQ